MKNGAGHGTAELARLGKEVDRGGDLQSARADYELQPPSFDTRTPLERCHAASRHDPVCLMLETLAQQNINLIACREVVRGGRRGRVEAWG